MKQYKLQNIRNIGFVGHDGSEKKSLVEQVLFTGVSDSLGNFGYASSVMDYDPVEIKRGLPISSFKAFCEINSTKINFVDTLGINNFINAKRVKIVGIDPEYDSQIIYEHVRMSEVLNYAANLTSMTEGDVCYGV